MDKPPPPLTCETPVFVIVGIISDSQSSRVRGLLHDLGSLPIGDNLVGIEALVLENGPAVAHSKALQCTVDAAKASLRCSLISIDQQADDLKGNEELGKLITGFKDLSKLEAERVSLLHCVCRCRFLPFSIRRRSSSRFHSYVFCCRRDRLPKRVRCFNSTAPQWLRLRNATLTTCTCRNDDASSFGFWTTTSDCRSLTTRATLLRR